MQGIGGFEELEDHYNEIELKLAKVQQQEADLREQLGHVKYSLDYLQRKAQQEKKANRAVAKSLNRKKKRIIDWVVEVLELANGPLSVSKIMSGMSDRGYRSEAKDIYASVHSVLNAELERKTRPPKVAKTEDGWVLAGE